MFYNVYKATIVHIMQINEIVKDVGIYRLIRMNWIDENSALEIARD